MGEGRVEGLLIAEDLGEGALLESGPVFELTVDLDGSNRCRRDLDGVHRHIDLLLGGREFLVDSGNGNGDLRVAGLDTGHNALVIDRGDGGIAGNVLERSGGVRGGVDGNSLSLVNGHVIGRNGSGNGFLLRFRFGSRGGIGRGLLAGNHADHGRNGHQDIPFFLHHYIQYVFGAYR